MSRTRKSPSVLQPKNSRSIIVFENRRELTQDVTPEQAVQGPDIAAEDYGKQGLYTGEDDVNRVLKRPLRLGIQTAQQVFASALKAQLLDDGRRQNRVGGSGVDQSRDSPSVTTDVRGPPAKLDVETGSCLRSLTLNLRHLN